MKFLLTALVGIFCFVSILNATAADAVTKAQALKAIDNPSTRSSVPLVDSLTDANLSS